MRDAIPCLYLDWLWKKKWSWLLSWFQIEVLNKHLLLTSKPVIYLVNLSEKDYIRKKNKWSVFYALQQALRWLGYVTSTPLSLASHGATYNNFTSTFDINPLILYFRLAKIKEWVDNNDSGAVIIPLSGALEYKVTQITKISVEFHSLLSRCFNKIPIVISLALKLCWLLRDLCGSHAQRRSKIQKL